MKLRVPVFAFGLLLCALAAWPASAQLRPVEPRQASQCQAIAKTLPHAIFASYAAPARQAIDGQVKITFLGHATFFIETPGGVSIATDFSGAYAPPHTPTVVTMNKA
ncbi:MAG: MBL fold metallo-hydrolase, partial [Rhizobium sp.]